MTLNSLNTGAESSSEGRSPANIRKYLVPKSLTSTENIKKALTSSDDNVTLTIPSKTATPSKPTIIESESSNTSKKTALKETPQPKIEKSCTLNDLLDAKKTPAQPSITRLTSSIKRSRSEFASLDNHANEWFRNLKPRKKSPVKESYDRLIPKVNDMPTAQFIINNPKAATYTDANTDDENYRSLVAKACGLDSSKRILSFTPPTPSTKSVDLRKNAPKYKLDTRTRIAPNRHILTSPEKVLDAPYMEDDYYLNLLDWSSLNIVAIGLGKSIYLWSSETGSIQSLNYDSDDQVTSVSWSNDGSYLSVGTLTGDTQVWDVESNTKLRSMTGQDSRVNVLSWDKHVVSSGARNGGIWHHDVRMAKHNIRELYGHIDNVCGLKWRWDGQLLASGGNDDTVQIWDARAVQPKFTKTTHSGAIKALAWCPWRHNTLATGGGRDDKNIHFWNVSTGTRENTIQAGSQVTSLHWSKHYQEIVSTHGNPHNQVTIWEYPSLNKVIDIPAHDTRILHSALSPDGQTLATAAADDCLKFFKIFEANGKSQISTHLSRLSERKQSNLKRSRSIR